LGATNKKDFEFANKLRNSFEKLTKLEKSALNKIEEVSNERLNSTKCEQCRSCLPCPNKVPIPEILRLRNIAIGYDQLEFSKERYNLIGKAGHWWEEKNSSFNKELSIEYITNLII